jgi:beta-alanine degradation protein BauB
MNRLSTIAVACGCSFLAGVAATWQQQGTTRREPQFENSQLRAWKSIIMPNQPLTQHRHEHGRALIALTDGRLKVVDQHGKLITTYDWKAGKAYWLDKDPPGQTHADVNDTGKTIEVIVVELQNDK